jgi:hypothetical protein
MTHTEIHDTAARMAAPGAPGGPPPASAQKGASKKEGAPRSPKTAAGGKTKAAPKEKSKAKAQAARAKQAAAPRAQSKGAQILALIGRPKGATLAEIRKTTGWQAHSVRGFLSSAAKKHNLQIESMKNEGGDREYHIQK